ncbi:thiamine phosphate synthase [Pleomorphovibrio marinus]|uniref:thiamine phosphate synthase n=1 Tax=Pleomorphovibrio marinus TaxID=2164132 RepID=UPI000E0A70BB|nr:thiamine phosphate synthase [Pleomorphovibrio marinus]
MKGFPYSLYLVTDQKACLGRDFFWILEEALKGGVDLVQLREKLLSAKEFTEKAKRTKEICDKYGVPLLVNDNPQVALKAECDGIHIGQKDDSITEVKQLLGEKFPVGLSLDQLADLTKTESKHAWYYGVSPIFNTPTKPDTLGEWGLLGLQELRQKTEKPLVAIGNIKLGNTASVIAHGADCIAVVSAICSADNPSKSATELRETIEKAKNA